LGNRCHASRAMGNSHSLFRRYLAENLDERWQIIQKKLPNCFSISALAIVHTNRSRDAVRLLVFVTFVILEHQLIVPGARTDGHEGFIREPIVESTTNTRAKKAGCLKASWVHSLGVRYSFSTLTAALPGMWNYLTLHLLIAPRIDVDALSWIVWVRWRTLGLLFSMGLSSLIFWKRSPLTHIKAGHVIY